MVSIQKKSDQTWLFCLERSKKWRDELIAKSKSMQMTMELIGIQSSDCPFCEARERAHGKSAFSKSHH